MNQWERIGVLVLLILIAGGITEARAPIRAIISRYILAGMNRILCSAMAVVFLCAITAQSQSSTTDKRLMTDANFRVFLTQVESALPKWETELKSIDLEKVPQISYSKGKSIMDQHDLGLVEVANIRVYLPKLRAKRTVSGELALSGFMQSLFDIGEEVVWEEDFSGLTLTHLEKDAPELSALEIRIMNDLIARVALLEKGTCPSSIGAREE